MNLSEEEAKKRWCPFTRFRLSETSRASTDTAVAVNRTGTEQREEIPWASRCIASRCMAWYFTTDPVASKPRRGYCALMNAERAALNQHQPPAGL